VLNVVAVWKRETIAPFVGSIVCQRPSCYSSWVLLMNRGLFKTCHALMRKSPNYWILKLGTM
jgi:hypothetical protein